MNIYPSILTDSLETAQAQLNKVKDLEQVKIVQIDIVDGQFADNLTITPLDLIDLDFGNLYVDLHFMVEEPMDFVYELETVKETLPIRAVISQIEKMTYFQDFIDEVKKQDWEVGLSLDLHTPVEEIKNYLSDLDIVQIMSIEAGFQGQQFQEYAVKKLDELQAYTLPFDIEIIVDGGVKPDYVERLKKFNVNAVSVGSALWRSEDISETMQMFSQS